MIRDIFYHPLFIAQFWVVNMVAMVLIFNYIEVEDMFYIPMITIIVLNLGYLHIRKSAQYKSKDNK